MAIKGEEMKDNITVRYTYSVRWEVKTVHEKLQCLD